MQTKRKLLGWRKGQPELLFLVVHGTVCAQYFFLRDFNPDERQDRVEILTLVRALVDMDIILLEISQFSSPWLDSG